MTPGYNRRPLTARSLCCPAGFVWTARAYAVFRIASDFDLCGRPCGWCVAERHDGVGQRGGGPLEVLRRVEQAFGLFILSALIWLAMASIWP